MAAIRIGSVPYLNAKYGFVHFFMGKSVFVGAREIAQNWMAVSEKFYLDALHFCGFFACLFGLFMAWKHRKQVPELFYTLGATTVAFGGLMLKSGTPFAIHSYYIVPFAPVMALAAGYALSFCKTQRIQSLLLFFILAENILNWQHDFRIKEAYAGFEQLESDLDRVGAKRSDLIFVNSKEVPTPLYFAHRKGWCNHNNWLLGSGRIDSLGRLGLKWVVIAKTAFGEPLPKNTLPLVMHFENNHYQIFSYTE